MGPSRSRRWTVCAASRWQTAGHTGVDTHRFRPRARSKFLSHRAEPRQARGRAEFAGTCRTDRGLQGQFGFAHPERGYRHRARLRRSRVGGDLVVAIGAPRDSVEAFMPVLRTGLDRKPDLDPRSGPVFTPDEARLLVWPAVRCDRMRVRRLDVATAVTGRSPGPGLPLVHPRCRPLCTVRRRMRTDARVCRLHDIVAK